MYTLGINAVYHDSAACLMKDGQGIAAADRGDFATEGIADAELVALSETARGLAAVAVRVRFSVQGVLAHGGRC